MRIIRESLRCLNPCVLFVHSSSMFNWLLALVSSKLGSARSLIASICLIVTSCTMRILEMKSSIRTLEEITRTYVDKEKTVQIFSALENNNPLTAQDILHKLQICDLSHSVYETNAAGDTILTLADKKGYTDFLRQLLTEGLFNSKISTKANALQSQYLFHFIREEEYSEQQKLENVRILLAYGANPNIPKEYNQMPLHSAAGRSLYKVVQCLLEYGADVNARCFGCETPLYFTTISPCRCEHEVKDACIKTLKILIEAGGDLETIVD